MTDAPTESVVLPLLGALTKAPTLDDVIQGEPDALVFAAVTAVLAAAVATMLLFARKPRVAMKPDEFQPFRLIEKVELSHDTRQFTFALQTPQTRLGLPVGQHISLRFTDKDGKNHQRSYTPVSGDETPGTVTFVIKVYKAGAHPKFPDGGKMSQHLDLLSIGDTVDMKGPKGHLTYMGQGKFSVKQMRKPLSERHANHFGMIAGGTGITPCLQVIHAILRDSKDTSTTVSLLFANQTEDDILVREELETIVREHPDRFKLHYTLDRPPSGWKYSSGFITKDMIEAHLPSASADGTTQILMCGPPLMLKHACIPALEELGFNENEWFCF